MFQINWKTKSLLYNIFSFLKLKKTLYLTQKYITKRSKVNISSINKIWKYHSDAIESNNIENLLEVGAGKSLEQNIYLSYLFKNRIYQTTIDINNMLDFELFNSASLQISRLLNIKYPGKITISFLEPIRSGLRSDEFIKILEKKIYDEIENIS